MTKKLEAVILDWAGTTMDYGCMAPAVVFQKVFAEMGVPITMEEARKPMGAHKKVHIQKITENPAVQERWKEQYGRKPAEDDVQKMFESFVPAQIEVLADYAALIPGTLEVIAELRKMGLKIGSTTGYTGDMMKVLMAEAAKQGYVPDTTVCATGEFAVCRGNFYRWGSIFGAEDNWNISRDAPHMCNLNAALLGVNNPYLCVKVGDTIPDILEGKNAGMWSVGLTKTGNEMGLTEAEINALPAEELRIRLQHTHDRMLGLGADYAAESIAEVPAIVRKINSLLYQGIKPRK
ncbi:MAG: phosphonoacetaldehyde hydrolase [Nanoarchaeota archaeon]